MSFEKLLLESTEMNLTIKEPYPVPNVLELDLNGTPYIAQTALAESPDDLESAIQVISLSFALPLEEARKRILDLLDIYTDPLVYITRIVKKEDLSLPDPPSITVGTVTMIPYEGSWFDILNLCVLPSTAVNTITETLHRKGIGKFTLTSAINDIIKRYQKPRKNRLTFGLRCKPDVVEYYERFGFKCNV
jgi:hypothetical protein